MLLNGAGYAKWTSQASLSWSRTAVTTREVENQLLEVAGAVTHSHGPSGEHSHSVWATHTWLDPLLAIEQARVVKLELDKLSVVAREQLDQRYDRLVADLQELDRHHRETWKSTGGRWLAADTTFAYLGRRYGLKLEFVHWKPDAAPTERQWAKLRESLGKSTRAWMLWTEEPRAETRKALSSLGVTVVVYRPASSRPPAGDYLTVMGDNLTRLQAAISDASNSIEESGS